MTNISSLVSVIVPVYNVEQYLEQCVESLIAQSYENTEIILVDDGSTDNSGKMCDSFCEKYSNVSVIHKKNAGLGMARNSGLEVARGEFVTFIDSDDYADKDLISALMADIDKNNADVCIGGFERVDNSGNVLFIEQYEHQVFKDSEVLNGLFMRMLGSSPEKSDSIRMSVWNTMYSMKIIRENNIVFPSERVYLSEDIIFDSEFYAKAKCAVVNSSVSYKYRVNAQSLTMKYKEDRFDKTLVLYKEIISRIKKLDMPPIAVLRFNRLIFVYLKVCIHSECPKVSGKKLMQAVKRVKEICSDPTVTEIVTDYPSEKLGFKQRLFVNLLKRKSAFVMVVLSQLSIM